MKRKTSLLLATTALSLIILSAASTLNMLPVEALGTVDQAWDPGPAVGGNAVKYHSPIGQSFTPTLNNLVGVDVNILNDPKQDAAEITYSGGDAIDYHSPIGQSFKPSYPLFTGFDVYLMNDETASRAVTMKLRSGTIGGPIIGSKTFSVSASSAWAWVHSDMSSPVPVNPGSLYVIELVESVGGVNWGVNLAGTYTGGNAIIMGADTPAYDNMFKTFGISDSVTANIRSGGIGGSVVGTSTKSVSVQGFAWTHIDFTQFSITPGSTYVLELVDTYGTLSWAWSSGAGYPGGTSIMMGTPADGDCYFRTYGIPAAFDFQITSDPASISLSQGGSGSSTMKVQSLNGFSSAVALSWSWLGTAPSDVTVNLPTPLTPPADGTGTATLTVTAAATATTGGFTLKVTGTSGALTHTVDVPVSISAAATTTTPTTTATTTPATTTSTTPPPSGCLVATATYGSELSPEVQFLRGFRDRTVLSTFAGSEFMKAFNAWYYSFSPSVASFIADNPTVRAAMK
nr:CFI-box-CTERM domain-containing protein [Candidatus Njordarchaeum guaymaensis]